MKIVIFERQFKSILNHSDILSEDVTPMDENKTLIVLQNRINDILEKKQKEILDNTTIKVVGNSQDLRLQIGQKVYPMKPMVQGVYAIVIPPNTSLAFGAPQMSTLLPEIEKIAEYKLLIEKHPEIKEQIEQTPINGVLYTDDQNQGVFKFTVTKKLGTVEDTKSAVPYGTEYPLGEFLERNKIIYKFKNGLWGTLESGALFMNLSSPRLSVNQPQVAQPTNPISISPIALGDLFNYNDVEFKDPAAVSQQLARFIQEVKTFAQKYGQPFIDHIKSQNPTVLGYSSIDGDPNQKIVGEYKPCAQSGTRQAYDLCLSNERAKKIADTLNQALPELQGAIKFKGMGETNQFGPAWTKENPTIPEQTAPNRRYVLSPIKPFMAQAQQPQQQTPQPVTGTSQQ